MAKPVVSVFCSAARPDLWLLLHENLSTSKISFEMVFVGPRRPTFKLPSNFRYIYSNVKPAQCYYIASYHCQGEYLMMMSDDMELSDGALDDLVSLYMEENSIISSRLSEPQTFSGRSDCFLGAMTPLIHRSLWDKLGFDRNYIAMYWIDDMAMQAQVELKTKVIISEKTRLREKKKVNLCSQKKGFGDRYFFYLNWFADTEPETANNCVLGEPLTRRKDPINPFVWTEDILTVSQGKKNDRWS